MIFVATCILGFYLFTNHHGTTIHRTTRRLVATSNVTIKYFKQFYKTILNPKPGDLGMNGTGVLNQKEEKFLEDKGIFSFNLLLTMDLLRLGASQNLSAIRGGTIDRGAKIFFQKN